MLKYAHDIVTEIENDAAITTRDQAIRALRTIGLSDFGLLLLNMPSPEFPRLSALLPAMAPRQVQEDWTGASGEALLVQSLTFVNEVAFHYSRISGRQLQHAKILDYGCGYGRLARLMYYLVDMDSLIGVDPWQVSVDHCLSSNMGEQFYRSNYLPKDLPVGEHKFDLAYAFSVFTHTSRRATLAALSAVRRHMDKNSVFIITVRPLEYWAHVMSEQQSEHRRALEFDHVKNGFAFAPHDRDPIDGDVTYGDTSVSLEWLHANLEDWSVTGVDRSLLDPLQLLVCLTAK